MVTVRVCFDWSTGRAEFIDCWMSRAGSDPMRCKRVGGSRLIDEWMEMGKSIFTDERNTWTNYETRWQQLDVVESLHWGVLCPTNVSVCVWFTLFFDLCCCCFPLLRWPRSHLHQVVFLQVGLQDGIFDGSKYKSNVLRIWNNYFGLANCFEKQT
jgi:hypothetical protein